MRYCSRCLQGFGIEDPPRCPRGACARPRPPTGWPEYLRLGETIDDRYDVDTVLGSGATGIAYKCWDRQDEEWVATKVLHADRKGGALAQRFAIEAEVLQLFDHPHIVPFRAVNLVRGPHHHLVTRYMEGGAVEGFVRQQGPFRPMAAASIGRQLALALFVVHDAGIVHRDLKPGNVLLEDHDPESPIVRLADFGIARIWRSIRPAPGITRTGAFIGTPEYAAPEQVRGEKGVGPAADAFALGAFLHFLATGEQVIRRRDFEDWERFAEDPRDPSSRPRLQARLPHEPDQAGLRRLDQLIDALMAERAADRPSMEEVARRLGATEAQITRPTVPVLPPQTLVSVVEGVLGQSDDAWDAWDGVEVEDQDQPLPPSLPDEDPEGRSTEPATDEKDSGPSVRRPIAPGPRPASPSPRDERGGYGEARSRPNSRPWLWVAAAILLVGLASAARWNQDTEPAVIEAVAVPGAEAPPPAGKTTPAPYRRVEVPVAPAPPQPELVQETPTAPRPKVNRPNKKPEPRKAGKAEGGAKGKSVKTGLVKKSARHGVARPLAVSRPSSVAMADSPPKTGSPVDRWAEDPEDTRLFSQVLEGEVQDGNSQLPEEIRNAMEEAEERAAWHEAIRTRQTQRVEELSREWDRALEESRQQRAEQRTGATEPDEEGVAWETGVEEGR